MTGNIRVMSERISTKSLRLRGNMLPTLTAMAGGSGSSIVSHVQNCVDEIAAELDALLNEDLHVRALAQLDEREARGETIVVIDATVLRQSLQRAIESNALTQAKRKLAELQLIVGDMKTSSRAVGPVAVIALSKPDVSQDPEKTVVEFPRFQTRVLSAEHEPEEHRTSTSRWPQFARVAAVLLVIIAASALTRHYPSALHKSASAIQTPIATAEAVCWSGCPSDPEAP